MQAIMDNTYDLSDKTHEQSIAAKQRFESFKLGPGFSARPLSQGAPKPSHGRSHSRSHSRNTSITSISSMPNVSLALSISTSNSIKSMNDMSTTTSTTAAPAGPPKQRPNSHHRRRSSVSTRRESAELMGVSVPDLPASKSEDNVNFGDKDSIRRRALWALEGKGDVAFAKVEIPELASPQTETSGFSFPTKPSFPAGSGVSPTSGLNALAGKRDSIGMFMGSAASKDQLGTLMEEEEEEDDENGKSEADKTFEVIAPSELPEPLTPVAPTVEVTKPSPARPRPASLNLRPLALTQGSVINAAFGGLPTPTLTPGPRSGGLKSLALAASPALSNVTNTDTSNTIKGMRRLSLTSTPSPTPPSNALARRPSLNINCDSPSPLSFDGSGRRSSISYKTSSDSSNRSSACLPTPDMTPIHSERKQLSWGSEDDSSPMRRPLSASEQHFLFKSHNALLARITDLENALSYRSRSRPVSVASDVSSNATSEPSDEMLSLISDLKSERDELKRDVDGWRTRVADLEDKVGVFAKRVESERREAWVARSRLGLLEVEKTSLEKALEDKKQSFQEALGKLDAMKSERDDLKADNERLEEQIKQVQVAEDECARLRIALEAERKQREELQAKLENVDFLTTPTVDSFSSRPRQMFMSVDSSASSTDVEYLDDSFAKGLTLNAVAEEDDEEDANAEDSYLSEEDNGLAGYEDEEDSDLSFNSPGGSSVDSMDPYTRAGMRISMPETPSLIVSDTSSGSESPTPVPTPTGMGHGPSNSLSKGWTFPCGSHPNPSPRHDIEEVDHFFGCLEDMDISPSTSFMAQEAKSKTLFSQSLSFDSDSDDEMPPFVLPSHVGVIAEAPARSLGVLVEEEEEEEDDIEDDSVDESFEGEEFEGGIRFTFDSPAAPAINVTPPYESLMTDVALPKAIARKPAPVFTAFEDEDEDLEVPFTFPQSKSEQAVAESISQSSSYSSLLDESDSDIMFSVRSVSPSSIPRATALKSFTSSTPTKQTSSRFVPPAGFPASSFITPPSKRGSMLPSLIPQPVASPLKNAAASKPKAAPATFLRQPQRKPLPTSSASGKANVNNVAKAPFKLQSSTPSPHHRGSSSHLMNVSLSDFVPTTPTHAQSKPEPQTPPSSFSSIMSFQTITNWWTPTAAPRSVAESRHASNDASSRVASISKKIPVERKFISRDKQLEKLRNRLDQERRSSCAGHFAVDVCRTCGEGEFHL